MNTHFKGVLQKGSQRWWAEWNLSKIFSSGLSAFKKLCPPDFQARRPLTHHANILHHHRVLEILGWDCFDVLQIGATNQKWYAVMTSFSCFWCLSTNLFLQLWEWLQVHKLLNPRWPEVQIQKLIYNSPSVCPWDEFSINRMVGS